MHVCAGNLRIRSLLLDGHIRNTLNNLEETDHASDQSPSQLYYIFSLFRLLSKFNYF